jgi:hypothetical protein
MVPRRGYEPLPAPAPQIAENLCLTVKPAEMHQTATVG